MRSDEINIEYLDRAIAIRASLIDKDYTIALRLFAGFYEGCPDLVVDCFGRTLVLHGYKDSAEDSTNLMDMASHHLRQRLQWVNCIIQKVRASTDANWRRGKIVYGDAPTKKIIENGIWYGIDLLMNQDTSFYLDTRNLRKWLLENSAGKSTLNFFAYTGTLGVAALAGGASRVVQIDRNRKFMDLAKVSCRINRLDETMMELLERDFFSAVAHFKQTGNLFDQVIVDPPFFSTTDKGRVNLGSAAVRVINKIRPLVKDGGKLIVVNNTLFLKGSDYLASLEGLCRDGYLEIENLIPVPEDITGFPGTVVSPPPVDPAPFNHPTKIVILKIRRKSQAGSGD